LVLPLLLKSKALVPRDRSPSVFDPQDGDDLFLHRRSLYEIVRSGVSPHAGAQKTPSTPGRKRHRVEAILIGGEAAEKELIRRERQPAA